MELHGSDRPARSCGIKLNAGRPVNSVVIRKRLAVERGRTDHRRNHCLRRNVDTWDRATDRIETRQG